MATTTIRALDAVTTAAVGDKIPTDQAADNVTRYLTITQILELIATVSQAEAEAGTATTRRIWTAERVKQAITALAPGLTIPVDAKTAAYTVTASDARNLIDATSGTWTLTLPAAATAGDGFWFAARNSGTGVVTIDADGSELIDGATTQTLAPTDTALLICNGSAWKTVGRKPPSLCAARGVVGVRASATTYQFTSAREVKLWNPTSKTIEHVATSVGSLTLNAGTAGPAANGRDQADAFSAGTWLYAYYIWNGTAVATTLSSTAPPTGPTLPSGYTSWAFICALRWNGSSNFLDTYVRGDRVIHKAMADATLLSGGTSTSFADLSATLATLVPPQASCPDFDLHVNVSATSSGLGDNAVEVDLSYDGSAMARTIGAMTSVDSSGDTNRTKGDVCNVANIAQTIHYRITLTNAASPSATIYVPSYRVANG
jgi:hypothetical protein